MDQRLEQQLGMDIAAFFAQHGEVAFREHEAALLLALAGETTPVILSTGGGAVLRESNRVALRQAFSPVFYLHAAPAQLLRRVKDDSSRPLLQVNNPMRRLHELYQARDPLYRQTAHYTVETGRSKAGASLNTIVMQLEMTHSTDM